MNDENKFQTGLITELNIVQSHVNDFQKSNIENIITVEQRFQRFINRLSEDFLIYELSPEGDINYVSPGIKKLLDYNSNEVLGKKWIDILKISAEYCESALKSMQICLNGQTPESFELQYVLQDGSMKYIETSERPVLDNYGRLIAIEGIAKDITKYKRSEVDLKHSEEKLRRITSEAQIILFSFNKDGRFTFSDGKGLDILGLKQSQLVGRTIFDVFKYYPQIINESERALAGEEVRSIVQLDNIFLDTVFTPRKNVNGIIESVIGVATDITNIIKAEQNLKQSESRLELLHELSIIVRADGTIDQVVQHAVKQVHNRYPQYQIIYSTVNKNNNLCIDFSKGSNLKLSINNFKIDLNKASKYLDALEYLPFLIIDETEESSDYEYLKETLKSFDIATKLDVPVIVLTEFKGVLSLISTKPHKWTDDEILTLRQVSDVLRNAIIQEIRKQAEVALRKSEARLKEAQHIARLGSWELDFGTNNLTWSEEVSSIFGIDRQKLITTFENFLNLVHPEDKKFVRESFTNSIENNILYDIIHRIIRPDKQIRYIHKMAHHILDSKGKIERSIGTIQDVTERIKTEEKLRRQSLMVDTIYDAIIIADTKDNIIDWNKGAENMFGYTRTEVLGKSPAMLYKDKNAPELRKNVVEGLTANGRWSGEINYIHKNSRSGYCETVVVPLFDENSKIIATIGINRDITEQKRSLVELKRVMAELEHSNKELEQFAYVASHDLQEPLRKIQAFGDRLKTKYIDKLDEQGNDYLSRMVNASERAQNLINDLLAFSQLTTRARPFTMINLNDITKEIIDDLEFLIKRTNGNIELDTLPTIEAEPTQIRQLMQNLIGNGLKFHKKNEPPIVKIYSQIIDDMCKIIVSDNGIGFDLKYLDRIFTIFQRLHKRFEYEGTGIGLAICKKVVDYHNGKITAESNPDAGAKFVVSLPIKQQNK